MVCFLIFLLLLFSFTEVVSTLPPRDGKVDVNIIYLAPRGVEGSELAAGAEGNSTLPPSGR